MKGGVQKAERVLRGGSWNNNARNVRSACRNRNEPGNRNNNIGFRFARAHGRAGWPASDPDTIRSALSFYNVRQKASGLRCGSRVGEIPIPKPRRKVFISQDLFVRESLRNG
jgi:hypothetical protein